MVVREPERATAGEVAAYEPLPTVGTLSIVPDGRMRPKTLVETTQVRVGPLSSVGEEFAVGRG